MSEQEQLRSVIRFYETHPINEYEILEKLRADGIDLKTLTEEVLKDYDQDHFGGLEAVDVLAEKAGINASTRVLTKCGFRHIGQVIDPEDGPVWRWERHRDQPENIIGS